VLPLISYLFALFLQTSSGMEAFVTSRCRLSVYITSHSQVTTTNSGTAAIVRAYDAVFLFADTNDCVPPQMQHGN
jgi:hypothetical protein